ncbi:hypothetical protein ACRAWD_12100 [Caulobacter segnis]
MTSYDLILAAAASAVCLALCATLWSLGQRRRFEARIAALKARLVLQGGEDDAPAWVEAFDAAVLATVGREARPAWPRAARALACARVLGVAAEPQAVVAALAATDPTPTADRPVRAWRELRLRGARNRRLDHDRGSLGRRPGLAAPGARQRRRRRPAVRAALRRLRRQRRRARLDRRRRRRPADVGPTRPSSGRSGRPRRSTQALAGKSFDRAADALAVEAAERASAARGLRWINLDGRRRAFRVSAQPLEGGGVGVFVRRRHRDRGGRPRRLQEACRGPRRDPEPHRRGRGHLQPDAAAVRTTTPPSLRRALGPGAGLAGRGEPTHGEVLDRLRQRRRACPRRSTTPAGRPPS